MCTDSRADNLNKCVKACKKLACAPDDDLSKGCNQMYSCSHACMIRHLGVSKAQCVEHCDRNGSSGCHPQVNGHKFELCVKCNRKGCSTYPTVSECETGCASYGKNYGIK